MNRLLMAALVICGLAAPATAQNAEQRVAWNRPTAPFRIIGNVYYIGTEGLGAYLIANPQGHVLIDGGLPESAAHILANIRALGFRPEDVEHLLINHAHYDHSGGLAEIKRATGARLVASAGDERDLELGRNAYRPELDGFPPVEVDRVVEDGDRVEIGASTLVAHLTPGHTEGCTSWSLTTKEGDRAFDILFACSLTVAGQPLIGNAGYPGAAADFRMTFDKLRSLDTDVFLNFHPGFFDLEGKRARLLAGDRFAFVDPSELARQVADAERAFETELDRQRRSGEAQ